MPRRRTADQSRLRQVRTADLFDSDRWAALASPSRAQRNFEYDSNSEADDNITRLLSESDTSMDKGGLQSYNSHGIKARGRFEVGLRDMLPKHSFIAADLGTPLAAAGSPNVMDEDDYLSMDVSCDTSGEHVGVRKLREPVDLFAQSPTAQPHDFTANTSTESLPDESRHGFHKYDASDLLPRSIKRRCLSSNESSPSAHAFSLPLPDQSGFEHRQHSKSVLSSPMCPPTPVRTPGWQTMDNTSDTTITYDSADASTYSAPSLIRFPNENFGEFAWARELPIMMRQNSLADNKVLMAQSEDGNEVDQRFLNEHSTIGGPPAQAISFYKDFQVLGLIGDGNFAEVFKVRAAGSVGDGGLFAVKKMKQQFKSRKYRDYLLNEVRVMKLLGHAHCKYVLKFVRAWQEDGYFYVQMGLAKGGCLKDLVNRMVEAKQVIPDDCLWRVLHDVAAGLQHMHSCNVVHLDIKPANLLVDDGCVVIGDFGMASESGNVEDGREGDTRYMALELLGYTPRLPSADLFSLGLTLYEMSYDMRRLESGRILLPAEGSEWHDLRNGRFEAIRGRPSSLTSLVYGLMSANPRVRPDPSALLAAPEVVQAGQCGCDLLQTCTMRLASNYQCRRSNSALSLSLPLGDLGSDAFLAMATPH